MSDKLFLQCFPSSTIVQVLDKCGWPKHVNPEPSAKSRGGNVRLSFERDILSADKSESVAFVFARRNQPPPINKPE
jgi:hypothetical protein